MAQPSSRGTLFFCWFFIIVGSVAVGIGGWMFVKSLLTKGWPATDGVIRSAGMKSSSNDKGTTYSPKVTYTYQVAGVSYKGDKIAIGQVSSSAGYAQGVLDRYPVGTNISVHYSPGNPAKAVLETGIHGGTWICLGVGTAFTLFGVMFLRILGAAAKAQLPGAPQTTSVKTNPDGSISMDKPPVLFGVICLLAGAGVCFAPPSGGTPNWIVYAGGGMFSSMGISMLLSRLENKMYSKIAMFLGLALFMAMFHWVAFGSGERIGTSTTPFSQQSGVNVRWPFAIVTILLDLALVAAFFHWLFKRRKD